MTEHAPDAGRPELVAVIRREIERDGPIPFARFMERALYEPELGYYASRSDRATRTGDFLTAPELHPIFGHALARQLHEMWQRLREPDEFGLLDYGAGTGALAVSLVDGLAAMQSPLRDRLRYEPIEVGARAESVAARLAALGVARPETGRARVVGCVIANEFLDALPVHVVVQRGDRLREVLVAWQDGRFVEVQAEPSTPELGRWFEDAGVELVDGQRAEVNLAVARWIGEVERTLERGYVLVIDYGAEPHELYGPARRTGTLRAFAAHRVSSDPLSGIGERDLTAHVDIGALERSAATAGLAVLGRTSQAEFLVGCGLEELLVEAQASLPEQWEPRLLLRSVVRRLLDPRHLGGYFVSVLGRGVPTDPPLSGLAFRLPARG